jgi:hypothetical protein
VPSIVAHHHPSLTRDPRRRAAIDLRNGLWTAWLRRPPRQALSRSLTLVARAPRDRTTTRAVAEAAAGLPWVLRRRRRSPAHVEAMYRRLESAR